MANAMPNPMNDPHSPEVSEEVVHLPTPTAWPLVLALGLTLGFAGLVTNAGISILGAVLIVAGCFGWFGQVWPHAQLRSRALPRPRVLMPHARLPLPARRDPPPDCRSH